MTYENFAKMKLQTNSNKNLNFIEDLPLTPYSGWKGQTFQPLIGQILRSRNILYTQWTDFHRKPKKLDFEQQICLFKGHEVFRLVSPIFRQNIYVGAFEELPKDSTPVDFFNPDDKQFPFLKDVPFLEASLAPGDCLYVPAFYYVQSRSLGSTGAHHVGDPVL